MYRYTVLVDDNYHYMDESERYTHGEFATLAEAIAECKRIVDEFLAVGEAETPSTADEMYRGYVACGPDPFITSDDPAVSHATFSAWGYARERCSLLGG